MIASIQTIIYNCIVFVSNLNDKNNYVKLNIFRKVKLSYKTQTFPDLS